jgi:hypothetical protein
MFSIIFMDLKNEDVQIQEAVADNRTATGRNPSCHPARNLPHFLWACALIFEIDGTSPSSRPFKLYTRLPVGTTTPHCHPRSLRWHLFTSTSFTNTLRTLQPRPGSPVISSRGISVTYRSCRWAALGRQSPWQFRDDFQIPIP